MGVEEVVEGSTEGTGGEDEGLEDLVAAISGGASFF